MRCKTKQRKGSRPDLILGYRRITVPRVRDRAFVPHCGTGEMNDHPSSTLLSAGPDRIRLIAIETMKGAFGNEGALHFPKQLTDEEWIFCAEEAALFPRVHRQ